MKIGNLVLENNIFLAPMAGVSDIAFRIICRQMGAGLVFSEMVSAKGIYYKDSKTKDLTAVDPRERPVALQIFGSDPDIMAYVVKEYLNERNDIDIIDINLGCPAPKIVKNGDGCALMKDPPLAGRVMESVAKVSNKPVTAKFRIGWDDNTKNGIEIAKIAEGSGISAITVHGRTREMFYSGDADWDFIKEVKDSVSIPVIGNGDIFQPKDGIKMLGQTGCDAISIGRGCQGNPWIFKRILNLINGKEDIPPTKDEIINMAIDHLNMSCGFKGERIGVREMRKQIAWYLKGMKNSNEIKNKVNTTETKEEIISILQEFLLNI